MNKWINYHHLYYFKVIAEEQSVSKAAEKLSLGQPTLSAQLKQFEENLEVQLFTRKHNKLIITEQGKIALEYAKSIFSMGSEMYDVLHDHINPLKQTLHIGVLDSISKTLTFKLTKEALNISPCQVTISEGSSAHLLRELTAHHIDIIISNYLPTGINAKGILSKKIAKNNIALYGAPTFKKLKKNFPESINDIPLVVPTYDSGVRPDLDHWAKLNHIKMNITVESQDIAVKKLMAINGIGLIAAAPHSVQRLLKKKELVEIGVLNGVYEELYILTTKRKIPNQIALSLFNNFTV